MGRLKSWFESRRKARDKAEYDAGYNWAAGEMLSGESPPCYIHDKCAFIDEPFDGGAIQAWRDYNSLRSSELKLAEIESVLRR